MSAFAPVGHAWYLWSHAHLLHIGIPYYLLEGVFLLAGCYVFAVGHRFASRRVRTDRMPEPVSRGVVARTLRYLGPLTYTVAYVRSPLHCRPCLGLAECLGA